MEFHGVMYTFSSSFVRECNAPFSSRVRSRCACRSACPPGFCKISIIQFNDIW